MQYIATTVVSYSLSSCFSFFSLSSFFFAGSYTYQGYLSKLPAQARKYLDWQLDWDDLQTISEVLVDWEKNLSRCIGLAEHEEHDIKNGKNRDNPFLQR